MNGGVKCFTCVVNKQDSAASHFIGSQVEVVKLLKHLAKIHHKKVKQKEKENQQEKGEDLESSQMMVIE